MRVLLSTHASPGGLRTLLGLAVRLRALGAEVWVCAPPDCAERLVDVGVPRGAIWPVGARDGDRAHVPVGGGPAGRAAEWVAAHVRRGRRSSRGNDALVTNRVMPAGVRP